MLARLNVGKLHTSAALVAVSLLGFFVIPASVAPMQQAYEEVQARQAARQQQFSSTQRHGVESKESEQERKNAPRRLDLLTGASGQPIDPKSIFALSSSIGDGFGKLVADKSGFGLEVKEPAGAWTRIPVVHFDKSLVLMRHGKDCVRLEDPVEPTANYYAICMMPEGITIHTVGELESFS
mgnify:CR=1 FL=1